MKLEAYTYLYVWCVHVCTFFSVHWYGMANTVLCRLGSFVIIDKNFIFSFVVTEFKITTCTYVCVILLSFFVLFFLRLVHYGHDCSCIP